MTGLPNLSRETKFSGANADRETLFSPVQLTTCRIGNLTRLIHTLAICVTIIHGYDVYRGYTWYAINILHERILGFSTLCSASIFPSLYPSLEALYTGNPINRKRV